MFMTNLKQHELVYILFYSFFQIKLYKFNVKDLRYFTLKKGDFKIW